MTPNKIHLHRKMIPNHKQLIEMQLEHYQSTATRAMLKSLADEQQSMLDYADDLSDGFVLGYN